jgi:uncharacterized protein YkwD
VEDMNKKAASISVSLIVIIAIFTSIGFIRRLGSGEEFSDSRAYRAEISPEDLNYIEIDDAPIALDPSGTENYAELRSKAFDIFTLMNNVRIANNLQELRWDYNLEMCANERVNEIAYYFDKNHNRPNGMAWYTVNRAIMLGENIYKGKKNAVEAMDSWMKNKADRENFLCEDFMDAAVAVSRDTKGDYYWVVTFGRDND